MVVRKRSPYVKVVGKDISTHISVSVEHRLYWIAVGIVTYHNAVIEQQLFSSTHVRGRSYQFEEFLLTWGDRLRSGGKVTTITAGLQRDVDKYQVHTVGERTTSVAEIGSASGKDNHFKVYLNDIMGCKKWILPQ